jgi:hypothetical protein
MVINDNLQPLNEVIIQYESEAVEEVRKFLQRLLAGKIKFVLEDAD